MGTVGVEDKSEFRVEDSEILADSESDKERVGRGK